MERVARREKEDSEKADADQKQRDKEEFEDADEQDMLRKIQKTYERYIEKKMQAQKKPRISKQFKDEQRRKDVQNGTISWKYVTYEDLDLLDLGQESNRTASLFVCSLILMIILLFVLISVVAITAIVSYASEEVEILQESKELDKSILVHNLFEFLTIMPTVMIVMQVLINLSIILMESVDEVFFYIRENSQGIWLLKGVFGLTLLLLTGMLGF